MNRPYYREGLRILSHHLAANTAGNWGRRKHTFRDVQNDICDGQNDNWDATNDIYDAESDGWDAQNGACLCEKLSGAEPPFPMLR